MFYLENIGAFACLELA